MITIEDIRNPKRKSGFDHVGYRVTPNGKDSYSAIDGRRSKGHAHPGSRRWTGTRRVTPEAAAQDYCDYINNQKPITIEDIRNPKRKSGFDFVTEHLDTSRATHSHPYRARATKSLNPQRWWTGPRRATPEEAAQDYCDYVNGQRGSIPSLPSYAAPQIDMGNTVAHAPVLPPVKVVRTPYEGPHDLYDVLLYDPMTGTLLRRKVGITARGQKRYDDICKTFGWGIKPHAPAVTYPSKAEALAAETAKVAEVAQDTKWVRVGKECFAPAAIDDETC